MVATNNGLYWDSDIQGWLMFEDRKQYWLAYYTEYELTEYNKMILDYVTSTDVIET